MLDESLNQINYDEVEVLLSSYNTSSVINQLNDYYREKSFLEILRINRKEIYHSNFLKWLFEDQDIYRIAVRNLLFLLLKRAKQQNSHFPEWLKTAILVNSFHIRQTNVKLEDSIKFVSIRGRVDLLIKIWYTLGTNEESNSLYVLIENKVDSQEHNVGKSNSSQTQAYYDYYTNEFGEENVLFAFLNPISPFELKNVTEPLCACKEFIHINYQDLLDSILTFLSDHTLIPYKKRFYIKEYIKGLSTNFFQNNSIMALEQNLRKLLIDFWDNNHKLIEMSIEALTQDPELDGEERQALVVVNRSIKELARKRDTTRYSIDGQGKFGKCAMVYEIVKKYLEIKKYDVTFSELQKVFPNNWRGKTASLSNMVVIDNERYDNEVSDKSKWRWKKIERPLKEGKYVYVINQWGDADHMRGIIKKINEIPELANVRIAEI